jgi:hypothetical protein
MATTPEPTVPEPYTAYVEVFSKAHSEFMPSCGHHNLAIKFLNSKQPLCGPTYNLSKTKLDTLHFYHEVQHKWG